MKRRRSQSVALLGLAVNLCLALLKLAAGIIGHTYALIADATESLADIVGSVVIWGGLHIGAKPADSDHPYGHGKAESLAALVVSVLVASAGVFIAIKAIDEIMTPHHTPAWWTLIVLLAVVAIKETMSRYTAAVARKEGNTALAVEAGHHRADVITSLAALVGICIALFGERWFGSATGPGGIHWASADDWAALLASCIIIWNGWRLARLPLAELMDAEPTDALERARAVTVEVPGVLGIEKARARTSGARHFLEMHVEVEPGMTVSEAHSITGRIKAAVKAQNPSVADVLIHIEPYLRTDNRV